MVSNNITVLNNIFHTLCFIRKETLHANAGLEITTIVRKKATNSDTMLRLMRSCMYTCKLRYELVQYGCEIFHSFKEFEVFIS
jgi:hypothetical protein